MAYEPYPASGPVQEPQRVQPPGSVLNAVKHTAEGARTIPLVIGGLIAIGLWLWMAWANGRGRGWARVLSAVLFGINTLTLVIFPFLPAHRFLLRLGECTSQPP